MTTFDINRNEVRAGAAPCFYKFHIQNRTKVSQVNYDFYELISGIFVRWVSGVYNGVIGAGNDVVINFDINENGIEEENVSFFTVGGRPLHVKFWTGGGVGGDRKQYINLLEQNNFEITQDSSSFNEVQGNGFRVTLDAGGQDKETMNIFFQIYDNH